MIKFEASAFGVKRNGTFWAIEKADMFGNTDKYDFLLQDLLENSYNGNNHFRIDVIEGKKACLGEWELVCIDLPGDWFGQYARFVLKDKAGSEYRAQESTKGIYVQSRETMIRKVLTAASHFVEQYDNVAFCNVCTGLELPNAITNMEELGAMINKLSDYIKHFAATYEEAVAQEEPTKIEVLKTSLQESFEKVKQIQISL